MSHTNNWVISLLNAKKHTVAVKQTRARKMKQASGALFLLNKSLESEDYAAARVFVEMVAKHIDDLHDLLHLPQILNPEES